MFQSVTVSLTPDYFRETNTCYNFHGCFWHGCPKCKAENRDDTSKGWSFNQKLHHTKKISQYIRESGYNLVEMWECDYHLVRTRTNNSYLYPTEEKFRMTEKEIFDAIMDERIFGAVEVDLHVPEHLKTYFAEMSPIFKHEKVTFEDIGAHMQDFVRSSGIPFQDRNYLIGSMFANKILLITPLLRWYVEHGIVLTKIHQLIQFAPKR